MRLGIDLDGVVCRFHDGWTAVHRAEFSSDVHSGQVVGWDGLHEVAGFVDMEAFWEWASPKPHRPSVFRHLDPYPGAIDVLGRLSAAGHELVVLTAKPRWAVPDTLGWIGDHAIPVSAVHFVEDKGSVECDVYVDDADHNLADIRLQRPSATVIRMVRPWNSPADGVHDVVDWDGVHRVVTSLSPGLDLDDLPMA